MARWEYMTIQVDQRPMRDDRVGDVSVKRFAAADDVLNALGEQGWEAVGVEAGSSWRVLLKRPLQDRR